MRWYPQIPESPARPALVGLALLLSILPACGPAGESSPPEPAAAESSSAEPAPVAGGDPLAAAIERCDRCPGARKALRDGRRLLAMKRFAGERVDTAAAAYVQALPAARKSVASFEAEWARLQADLGPELAAPSPDAFEGIRPATARALAEAALPQVKAYHLAALDYGRNTTPQDGLFYLGVARAQSELVGLFRDLDGPPAGSPPPVRPLDPELDKLESELTAAYRPPASIAKHGTFTATSATLKEARELNDAGLLHGALLRTLEAAQGLAALGSGPPPDREAISGRISALDSRLSKEEGERGIDHSIGRMFLEAAQDHASGGPGMSPAVAEAIVGDVLPLYFAALGPAPPASPKPAPSVAVTLVRWPYT